MARASSHKHRVILANVYTWTAVLPRLWSALMLLLCQGHCSRLFRLRRATSPVHNITGSIQKPPLCVIVLKCLKSIVRVSPPEYSTSKINQYNVWLQSETWVKKLVMNAIASSSSASEQLKKPNGETSDFSASELHSDTHSLVRLLHSEAHMQAIDNLQNYCLGTRYGARSRWRLCRRLAIDMVLKIFLSTISSRFGDVLTLTIYLQTFCEFKTPFFFRGKRPIFRQEATVHGRQWGRRRWRGMSCSCAVVHRLCKAVSIFFFFFFFFFFF